VKVNLNIFHKNIISAIFFAVLAVLFITFVFLPSVKKINTDFPNYYVSANMYLDGKDLKAAYNNVSFNRELLLYGIEGQIVSFIPYPPLTALLMTPLARLEPLTAKLYWNIFNLLLLALSIFLLKKLVSLSYFAVGIIFFLSAYALANNFLFGQAYMLVLLFLILFIYFMIKGQAVPAALFLSLSIVLKFYTVFFVFLFIFKKEYRLLLYTIIFTALLYIPAVLLTGFELNYFYYTQIMPRLGDGWVGTVYAAEYQSFVSLLHRLFDYEPMLNPDPLVQSALLFYFLKYVYMFTVLAVSAAALKPGRENLKPAIALFCIVCLLLLPLNASYQYVILLPAVVFLSESFLEQKKYFLMLSVIVVMFFINSPLQVMIVSALKNTPFFILAYLKPAGLIFLWIICLRELNMHNKTVFSSPRLPAYAAIAVVLFTALSFYNYKPVDDGAEFVQTGNNYMVSMPSAVGGRLLWTECIGEKFVLRTNFGFSYDKENVFYPVFTDSVHVAFETIENRKPKQKVIDLVTGIQREASSLRLNVPQVVGSTELVSLNGVLWHRAVPPTLETQITSGRQFCYFPVFAGSDSMYFCSDRNRGVGFTALYKRKIAVDP
jgi:hypothetical protein